MSDLMLNFNLSHNDEPRPGKARDGSTGNTKHQCFLRKRRFLERKGFLHDKQNQVKQTRGQKPKQSPQSGPPPWKSDGKHPSQTKAVFPKFTTPKPGLYSTSSTSTSMHTAMKNCSSYAQTKKRTAHDSSSTATSSQGNPVPATSQSLTVTLPNLGGAPPFGNPLKYLALDCEMVGTGPKGRNSELARCSVVSYSGDVVYDKYIRPTNPVTDYRTRWSGISWHHLRDATPFLQAKKEIVKLLFGKVVVGHAIHNDFKALSYTHPVGLTRDTARIPLLNRKAGLSETEPASLKRLTKALFNRDIQTGKKGHSSVEDAKATMELYRVVEVEWERTLASKPHSQ